MTRKEKIIEILKSNIHLSFEEDELTGSDHPALTHKYHTVIKGFDYAADAILSLPIDVPSEEKIAVFSKSEFDFKSIEVNPSKMFIWIKNIHDIHGRKFTGIIKIYRWWSDKDVEEAYEYLRVMQPELFD